MKEVCCCLFSLTLHKGLERAAFSVGNVEKRKKKGKKKREKNRKRKKFVKGVLFVFSFGAHSLSPSRGCARLRPFSGAGGGTDPS